MKRTKEDEPKEALPLHRLLEVAHALETKVEADLADAGLSMAKLGVLRVLAQAEEPLTLGGIAESVRCVRSNMTQMVDRLEGDGLVRRVADAADRRVKRAELTVAGRRAAAEGLKRLARHEAEVLEVLGDELAALTRALDRLAPPA